MSKIFVCVNEMNCRQDDGNATKNASLSLVTEMPFRSLLVDKIKDKLSETLKIFLNMERFTNYIISLAPSALVSLIAKKISMLLINCARFEGMKCCNKRRIRGKSEESARTCKQRTSTFKSGIEAF